MMHFISFANGRNLRKTVVSSFEGEEALRRLGANIRAARLRRNESETMLAQRLGVSRATVNRLESGDAGVAMGLMIEALLTYGFGDQVFSLADPDTDGVGKRLEGLRRPSRGTGRSPKVGANR